MIYHCFEFDFSSAFFCVTFPRQLTPLLSRLSEKHYQESFFPSQDILAHAFFLQFSLFFLHVFHAFLTASLPLFCLFLCFSFQFNLVPNSPCSLAATSLIFFGMLFPCLTSCFSNSAASLLVSLFKFGFCLHALVLFSSWHFFLNLPFLCLPLFFFFPSASLPPFGLWLVTYIFSASGLFFASIFASLATFTVFAFSNFSVVRASPSLHEPVYRQ